jgi:DMSO/TMAO reductase YedYZ molybdopterin-dependent catalytic subunit
MEDSRRYGRRTFLAVVGAGIGALVWGKPLQRVSASLSPLEAFFVSDGWRIYSVGSSIPRFDPRTWRLRVDGLVEHPLELTYAQVLALPRVRQVSDFHCVTGWSVPKVRWSGVRFHDLLAAARPLPSARALTFTSMERPYEDSLTLEQALEHDVLLAYGMDGRPLTRDHGAPARVVIPEMYGYKGVKWLERITLTPAPEEGYWEARGYDTDAYIGHSNGYG